MKTQKQRIDRAQLRRGRKMNHKCSRRGDGLVEVQTWGLDGNRELVCAGVHYVRSLTARTLYKLATSWRRWRKWYDSLPENRCEDYPAKHGNALAFYGAHPIDCPKQAMWIAV